MVSGLENVDMIMNEWMFNDTPAQKVNRPLCVKQMVFT